MNPDAESDLQGDIDQTYLTEPSDREQEWKTGFHTTSKGDTIALKEMATPHLQNTINKFQLEGLDTTPLEEELASRN